VNARLLLTVLGATALLACGATTASSSPSPETEGKDGTSADGGQTGSKDDAGVASDGGEAPACPVVGSTSSPGKISGSGSKDIEEISGIVRSTLNDGVYWVHNDSGDSARAFAIGADGKLLAELAFDSNEPVDIEDMAIEDVSSTVAHLYFADIGDNDAERDGIVIHRVVEPKLAGATALDAVSEKMQITYSDGPHNAETLLFDPQTKDLILVTKEKTGQARVHRVGPFLPGGSATTEKIADIDVVLATGGDISRDGRLLAVRNYDGAWIWSRGANESLATALARPPCPIATADEEQGEAFAFLPDRSGFVTVSEGKAAELHLGSFE
jgi:hypothetical protein